MQQQPGTCLLNVAESFYAGTDRLRSRVPYCVGNSSRAEAQTCTSGVWASGQQLALVLACLRIYNHVHTPVVYAYFVPSSSYLYSFRYKRPSVRTGTTSLLA